MNHLLNRSTQGGKRLSLIALAFLLVVSGLSFTRTARADANIQIFGLQIVALPNTPNFIGDWQIGNPLSASLVAPRVVHITNQTVIKVDDGASIAIGSYVLVTGSVADNSFNGAITATLIEVKKSSPFLSTGVNGTISELPNTPNFIGDWKIAGPTVSFGDNSGNIQYVTTTSRAVHVTDKTIIRVDTDARIAVGSYAEVTGTLDTGTLLGGAINATQINVKKSAPSFPYNVNGTIQQLPNTSGFIGDWKVLQMPPPGSLAPTRLVVVSVSDKTTIKVEDGAQLAVGSYVEITGTITLNGFNGAITATQITVKKSPPPPPANFDFYGTIEKLPDANSFVGDWTISNRTIKVTNATIFKTEQGAIKVGAFVRAKVSLQTDGTLAASSIEVLKQPPVILPPLPPQFVFFGAVETLPNTTNFVGDWKVGGRAVHVGTTTKIDQSFRPLVVGAFVMIAGSLRADGSIDATLVRVERNVDLGKLVNFFEFNGKVETLPNNGRVGDWKVSGQIVRVSATTKIFEQASNPLKVGSRVVVTGVSNADGTLQADRIFVLRDITASQSFVAQNYRDFLNREPDEAGLNFWTNEIDVCGGDAQCVDRKRVNTSGAFFLSTEFQQTGYLVYRFYKASFGRTPRLAEFTPDTQAVGNGVVINADGWQDKVAANKRIFAEDWVQHPAFAAIYENMSDGNYVDVLFANAGVTPDASERSALINGLANGTETRASVLTKIVENQKFYGKEFNRAFVLMQYFGYLRRNPDDAPDGNLDGYNFWLDKLNRSNGDYLKAEMVRSFILSSEYRARFSQQ